MHTPEDAATSWRDLADRGTPATSCGSSRTPPKQRASRASGFTPQQSAGSRRAYTSKPRRHARALVHLDYRRHLRPHVR
jgi:hypothetical protein